MVSPASIGTAFSVASSRNVYAISWHFTQTGGVTFASNIALKYGEAGDIGTGALIASGLCLFIITLIVNFSAQLIINRQRKGA